LNWNTTLPTKPFLLAVLLKPLKFGKYIDSNKT